MANFDKRHYSIWRPPACVGTVLALFCPELMPAQSEDTHSVSNGPCRTPREILTADLAGSFKTYRGAFKVGGAYENQSWDIWVTFRSPPDLW